MSDCEIVLHGESRSFPVRDGALAESRAGAPVLLHLGQVGEVAPEPRRAAVLIELDTECLSVHLGDYPGAERANTLGFARYRNGNDAPTNLVELVRPDGAEPEALAAARAFFESIGCQVAVCADRPGRIVDRLVRPKYNDALRFLDDGLATATAMDMTCRMGLGYPDGLIERTERGGLARHHEICAALQELTGNPAYAPARRAVVAMQRKARR